MYNLTSSSEMSSGAMQKLEKLCSAERTMYHLRPTSELRIGIKWNLGSICAVVMTSRTSEYECHPGTAETYFSLMSREPEA